MGTGLHVEVTNRESNSTVNEQIFHDFPVRIGRDALAEVSLPFAFVTRWHAVLKVEDDAVLLWDLGSTNGTTVGSPPAKLPPHEKIDLRRHGMAFAIGPLDFSLETVETEAAPRSRDRGGPVLSSTGNAPLHTHFEENAATRALAVEASALAQTLRNPVGEVRAARGRLRETLTAALRDHAAPARVELLHHLARELPELVAELDVAEIASSLDLGHGDIEGLRAVTDEALALEVLRELAAWYHTPHPLIGREAIVGFGQKIQDALDALFAGYVPLRNGMKTFAAEFEVAQKQSTGGGASSLFQAQTPLELGVRALDWSDPLDGAHAFRSLFADVMIHNMSLIGGVMKGAAALIHELSPSALSEAFEEARKAGRTGIAVGVFRYRELWRALERRHAEFAKEENETFKLLFGREFASTYDQFFSAATAESVTARPPPEREPRNQAHEPLADPRSPAPATKTPENHGQPPARTRGPTGTVIAAVAGSSPNPLTPPQARRDGRS
jgi:type VI secretion system protein ImpI